MERRKFLGALTAASVGLTLEGSFPELARAQNNPQADTGVAGQASKVSAFLETQQL
jgi:hypothetical protein